MDGTVFGFGLAGAVATVAGVTLFLGQQNRLTELAIIPTSVALTRAAIGFKRSQNMLLASSSAAAELLDDGVDAIITGTVTECDGHAGVRVETAAQKGQTGDRGVAAVSAVVTKQTATAGHTKAEVYRRHTAWTTFEIRDETGAGVVCPQHSFRNVDQLPKTLVAHERWETEEGWFGGVELKQVSSYKQSFERASAATTDEVGFEVREASLPFGATVTVHGKVRQLSDNTLVVEDPVTVSQDSKRAIVSRLILVTQRKKYLALGVTAVGIACFSYAFWRYRERVQAKQRRPRRNRQRREEDPDESDDDIDDEDDDQGEDSEEPGVSMTPRDQRRRNRRGGATRLTAHQHRQRHSRQLHIRHHQNAPSSRHPHHLQPIMQPVLAAPIVADGSAGAGANILGGAVRADGVSGQPVQSMKPSTEDVCIICLTETKNAVLVPCGHQSMCHDCALQWLMSSPHRQCPICRQRVTRVQKIFKT